MTEQQNNKKSSMGIGCVLIRIAAVLFCLVVVSTYLMSGLFARYVSTGNGGDSARVAGFDVVVTGDQTALDISCTQNSDTYTITVQNNSEVAVEYTLSVDTAVADGSKKFDKTAVTAAFDSNSGALAVGAAPVDHTLTFSVNNWSGITENLQNKDGENSVSLAFTVTVDVAQID